LRDFNEVRREFPGLDKWHYLDTAATGLIPRRTLNAVNNCLKDQLTDGELKYLDWLREAEKVREKIAKLINASTREIAFVKNTSEGLSIIANGLKLKKNDNVILNDLEFPANVYPWMKKAKLKFVKNKEGKIELEDIEEAIDENTKAVSISSVQFSTGFRVELERLGKICRDKGIYLIVDGIQSIGALEMDVKKYNIDFLSCGSYKWLISPPGLGFLYISERVMNELEVTEIGWMSVKDPFNYYDYRLEFDSSARRFECGNLAFPLIYGLGASLDLINEVGIKVIEKRIVRLNRLLTEDLERMNVEVASPLEDKYRSGIVLFNVKNEREIAERLRRNKVIISVRKGIRVSIHFYNNEDDLDKLVNVIKRYAFKN